MDRYTKYIEYKSLYSNLKSIDQIGGKTKNNTFNNYRSWLPKLWGKIKYLEKVDRIQVIDRPNSDHQFVDNDRIKFSFLPEMWNNSHDENNKKSDEVIPIENNHQNRKALARYIKSSAWKNFLKYCFGEIWSTCCTRTQTVFNFEMYTIDKMKTTLEDYNGAIMIVIRGTIKKYTYDEFKKLHELYNRKPLLGKKHWALDETWTGKKEKPMNYDTFYEQAVEGFYKSSEEGEMKVPGMGQLSLGIHTHMKLEFDK